MDQITIRNMRVEEYATLKDLLYEAIYVPPGDAPPPRSVADRPELRVYFQGFGSGPLDRALAAVDGSRVVGSVWCRLMDDYGHIDDETPSLAAALYPEYRGQGIGTELLRAMMDALEREGVRQVSLSVQKGNPGGPPVSESGIPHSTGDRRGIYHGGPPGAGIKRKGACPCWTSWRPWRPDTARSRPGWPRRRPMTTPPRWPG